MTIAVGALAPSTHVIVDNLHADGWAKAATWAAIAAAVASIIAVFVAVRTMQVATRTLDAEQKELELAEDQLQLTEAQLAETQSATRQTQEALEFGRRQVQYAQKADVDRMRSYAPQVTARLEFDQQAQKRFLRLSNSGASATYLLVTVRQNGDGSFANGFTQKLDPGEDLQLSAFWIPAVPGHIAYLQFLRIRSRDALGNKYITEYRSLGEQLACPVLRKPWLGREYGSEVSPRPERCSDEVSWAVEHFERIPGQDDEPVEQGFNIEAPA